MCLVSLNLFWLCPISDASASDRTGFFDILRVKQKRKTILNQNTSKYILNLLMQHFYLLFFRMHRTIQQATTPMMHSVNTSAPTIVATKMIGCLIFTTNSLRSIETALRMITNTVNDLTFKTLCAYWRFCWHSSMVDHCSHVSCPSIMYGPSMWRMQYSKFGEPLQKILSW